jgi:hypothetical protein
MSSSTTALGIVYPYASSIPIKGDTRAKNEATSPLYNFSFL